MTNRLLHPNNLFLHQILNCIAHKNLFLLIISYRTGNEFMKPAWKIDGFKYLQNINNFFALIAT